MAKCPPIKIAGVALADSVFEIPVEVCRELEHSKQQAARFAGLKIVK
jgi:hypothetical protein